MTNTGADQGHPRASSADALLIPSTLELSPIRRLLVIDVADDPTYRTLEPQALDGPHGPGLVLLAYRHDDHVEVYADSGSHVDPSGYDGLGKGLLGIHRTAFQPGRFEVTADGLKVDIAFTAPDGRRVDLHMHEHLTGPRDRIPVLAPVGGRFDTPEFFPFVWLPGLSFVPVRGTEVTLRVDGHQRSIPRLPLPIGGRRCLMARYDPDVMVCQLNSSRIGAFPEAPTRRDGLAGTRVTRGDHTCAVHLDPPLPDVANLRPGTRRQGAVLLQADGVTELRGRYEIARAGDRVHMAIDRFGPWRTRQRRPLLAILFRLPIFRRWPTTYRWEGTLDLTDPGSADVRWTSRWSRTTGSSSPNSPCS